MSYPLAKKVKNIVKTEEKFVSNYFVSKYLDTNNPELLSWINSWTVDIKNNNLKSWQYVDWERYEPAIISLNTTEATDEEGKRIVSFLNESFMKEISSNINQELGEYVDREIIVHGMDMYDQKDYLFDPINDYIATTYLQSQLDLNNINIVLRSRNETHFKPLLTFFFDCNHFLKISERI